MLDILQIYSLLVLMKKEINFEPNSTVIVLSGKKDPPYWQIIWEVINMNQDTTWFTGPNDDNTTHFCGHQAVTPILSLELRKGSEVLVRSRISLRTRTPHQVPKMRSETAHSNRSDLDLHWREVCSNRVPY